MNRFITRWPSLAVLTLVLLMGPGLLATSAFAQATNTGTVVGTVADQSGAVVPGATITLTNLSTNESRSTTSNDTGQYVMVNVPPADYRVSVTKDGFSKTEVAKQTVSVGSQVTDNFKLKVGSTEQTVEVTESAADLQTLNATVGATVTPAQIDTLPALGRDVTTFATLQPGVSPEGSVAGTVVDQASFQLDGGDNTNDMDGSGNVYTGTFAGTPSGQNSIGGGASGVMPTPVDSVEEFKSNTANQTADFDNSSGAQVEIVTRRGTDHWHGTAYEYYLDNNWNANTWQNNLTDTPNPSYHYSRYGFAGGGPLLPKPILGGKTFFFANWEAYRFPNSATYERAVPSAALRAGTAQFGGVSYNLQDYDPRHIGIAPVISQLWNTYEPVGNDPSCGSLVGQYCDGVNEVGYKANVNLPTTSNFFVARVDHDFGSKNHFMASYRYYKLTQLGTEQVDIGGGFAGDKLGTPVATANRPQQPWYFVAELTTTISATTTNDIHYSFLRNFWQWGDKDAPPQISGLGGALEPGGETENNVLSPYNVDSQDIRTRVWDGQDNFVRDDVTMLKGNHLLTFGGQYQHNFDYHTRSDNGGGINFTTTYQLGDAAGSGEVNLSNLTNAAGASYAPGGGTGAARVASEVLGIVTDSQVAYTRTGNSLTLNPPLTAASEKATIPYYNVYFSDSWHLKPSLTLTYGLGYTLEMPPVAQGGKQDVLVDSADEPVELTDYIAQRKAFASQGQVYNPQLGFALVGNVGSGYKYPYDPFYGSFSPRVAAAWNPKFSADGILGKVFGANSTVIRGGYGRIYGRLNGVDLVLVPLLGDGLIQAVQCRTANMNGTCASQAPTASNAFRIGVDGNSAPLAAATPTLPQPIYPGYNAAATSAGEALDPHFRPNDVDSIDLTIQRQLTSKTLIEVGYIGRLIHHEFQPINLNAVPYMMSQGGQTFASAYAAIETGLGCATSAAKCILTANNAAQTTPIIPTVSPQPFFETALAGTGYCNGYASCTQAVVDKEINNLTTQAVWSLWSDLDGGTNKTGGGFNFAPTMQNTAIQGQANGANGSATSGTALNASIGHGNYNGGFVSFKASDWHGLTLQSNFTYSKSLGTGAVVQASSEYTANDPFNLNAMYGRQGFDHKFIFNNYMVWNTPWYKGQEGLVGRVAGGWSVAPIFVAGSGAPIACGTNTGAQSWGAGDGVNFFDNENCVFTSKYTGGASTHRNIAGSPDSFGNSVGTSVAGSGHAAINMFANPAAVFDQVRAPILGIDTKNPGLGPISGLPYWNMDVQLQKVVRVAEGAEVQLSMVDTNVLNHLTFASPGIAINSTDTWGVVTSQGNLPRQMQFGIRIRY
jgi:hypothetical protein